MDLIIILSVSLMTGLDYYLAQRAAKYLDPNFNKIYKHGIFRYRFSLKKKDYIDEKGIKFRNYWLINEIIKNTLFFSWLIYTSVMTFIVNN